MDFLFVFFIWLKPLLLLQNTVLQNISYNARLITLLYLSFKFSPNKNNSYGPLLCTTKRFSSTNYYFDGHTENHRPTHDPLGGNSPNQKKNFANPHGNIFIWVE